MKIVNERGTVVTSEEFRKKLGRLVAFVMNGHEDDPEESSPAEESSQDPRTHALEQVRSLGIDPHTKAGQAAAGAAMIASTLSEGIREYERKNSRSIPRAVMLELQDKIAQLSSSRTQLASATIDIHQKSTPPPVRGEVRKFTDL